MEVRKQHHQPRNYFSKITENLNILEAEGIGISSLAQVLQSYLVRSFISQNSILLVCVDVSSLSRETGI